MSDELLRGVSITFVLIAVNVAVSLIGLIAARVAWSRSSALPGGRRFTRLTSSRLRQIRSPQRALTLPRAGHAMDVTAQPARPSPAPAPKRPP